MYGSINFGAGKSRQLIEKKLLGTDLLDPRNSLVVKSARLAAGFFISAGLNMAISSLVGYPIGYGSSCLLKLETLPFAFAALAGLEYAFSKPSIPEVSSPQPSVRFSSQIMVYSFSHMDGETAVYTPKLRQVG